MSEAAYVVRQFANSVYKCDVRTAIHEWYIKVNGTELSITSPQLDSLFEFLGMERVTKQYTYEFEINGYTVFEGIVKAKDEYEAQELVTNSIWNTDLEEVEFELTLDRSEKVSGDSGTYRIDVRSYLEDADIRVRVEEVEGALNHE